MKLIAVSQRVDISASGERRDALDQRWFSFFSECNLLPILVPNCLELAKSIVKLLQLDGVLLTGGNDLSSYGGDAPERDETEVYLLECAIRNKIPVFGICRGMQLIQNYYGVKLSKIDGHVGCKHRVLLNGITSEVNSFHNYGSVENASELEVLGRAEDGVVEVLKHKEHLIKTIMWHPERNKPFSVDDIKLVKEFFN